MAKHYVGVSGLSSMEEVDGALDALYETEFEMDGDHAPMLGFLVSYKTLDGARHENPRYPLMSDLSKMMYKVDCKAIASVHYNTNDPSTLSDQVRKIFDADDMYRTDLCRTLQLNVPWPPLKEVDAIKSDYRHMKIILQVSRRSAEGMSPEQIADRVSEYAKASYVLIDPSGGTGAGLDVGSAADLYRRISKRMPNVKVGFAGGLGPSNVKKVCEEMEGSIGTRGFSIDAESGLRDGNDSLDRGKLTTYLERAKAALTG